MKRREADSGRLSVFWRVSGTLIIAQIVTGLLAILISAWFAQDRSRDLAENSLRVRIDVVAEEIERAGDDLEIDLTRLPEPLLSNLSYRFPDPIVLVDTSGTHIETIYPSPDAFPGNVADSSVVPILPPGIAGRLRTGDVVVDRGNGIVAGGWALAPLYDANGFEVGGLLIQPIVKTLLQELAPTRKAFTHAIWTVVLIAVFMAVALGAGFTWWLVGPLRRMAERVQRIGSGDFSARVPVGGATEMARLGQSINSMAEQIEGSIEVLRRTDRLRRELVANIGHDLRTPLAALKGFVEEADRFEGEGRHDEALAAIQLAGTQSEYVQRLVDDLFELSQLENPEPSLHLEPVPLLELLGEVSIRHKSDMHSSGITFRTSFPDTLPVIRADGVRLLRMLDNLLSNARRHTPKGGEIILAADRIGHEVEIRVEDTGSGIASDVLPHIFERYYRGDESRTRTGAGTGLGLAISRAVAESHGGVLLANSALGQGTVMTVRLPV